MKIQVEVSLWKTDSGGYIPASEAPRLPANIDIDIPDDILIPLSVPEAGPIDDYIQELLWTEYDCTAAVYELTFVDIFGFPHSLIICND